MMYNCFFANKREGGLKIFKSYRFTSDLDISEEILWIEGEGPNDINFENIGDYIRTERYLEPEDCDESMKEYERNK